MNPHNIKTVLAGFASLLITAALCAQENPFAATATNAPKPAAAVAAAGNPFEQGALDAYVGRFRGGDTQLRLKPEGRNLLGTLELKGRRFTVKAALGQGQIEGEFRDEQNAWHFNATSDGKELVFVTEGVTSKLQRQGSSKLGGVYQSDRVWLSLEDRAGRYEGTLKYNGKTFPITGALVAGDLEGTFGAGGQTYAFTLSEEEKGLAFRTGPFMDVLKRPYPKLDQPWTNTLGMIFVPVAGTKVLFSVWDVRVQDYAAYAAASSGVDGSWQNVEYKSVRVSDGPTHPVTKVSWDDTKAFCKWLTEKDRAAGSMAGDQSYRLPTDAEWSAAVGLEGESSGTPKDKDAKIKDVYPWGTDWPPPNGAGNYADRTAKARFADRKVIDGYDDGFATTSPVGSFKANKHGLFDMGGNVWQWCEDWYDGEHKSRVLRGGSWDLDDQGGLLSSFRNCSTPENRGSNVGFRCVLVGGLSR